MDRDKPPFGPAGNSMDPPGDNDSWSDRDLNDRARRAASERETAEKYRFARSEQREPTITDDFGGAGDEPPRRSFERMGRFSRDTMDSRRSGDNGSYSTPSSRLPEPERDPRGENPAYSDRAGDGEHPPAPKRPAFLNRARDDGSRSEHRRPSFLDRANDSPPANAMRPSFLDRADVDETVFDEDDFDERPQPVRRSFRGAVPGQDAGASGAADITDWSMASDQPSEFGDGGYERADPRERRYEPSHPRQDGEPSSQASKDWRSSRFASRFSQPPKAYDLDEVADQDISFDPASGGEPGFETPRDAGPRFSEEDLVQKARARSRSRFGRSLGVADNPDAAPDPTGGHRYNQFDEPPWEPEALPQDQMGGDGAYEPSYEEDVAPPAQTYLPAEGREAAFDSPNSAGDGYQADAGPDAVDEFSYEPEDGDAFQEYMPQDNIAGGDAVEPPYPADNAAPARSADVYSMQAPIAQRYDAAAGQPYDDPSLDPYEMELDQDQHGYDQYDDYDVGGRHPGQGPTMDPNDMRGERGAGPDDGYAPYAGTFQDFEEKEGRRPVVLIGALVGVAVLAGGLIFAYQMFAPEGNDQVPVVKLEDSPSKVAPNEPGGLDIPHQNKLIYDRIAGEETEVTEKVVSREEKVIELEPEKVETAAADAVEDAGAAVIPPAPDEAVPENQEADDNGLEEATAILDSGDGSDDASEESTEAEAAPAAAEPPLPDAPEESIPLRVETVDPPAGSETEVARAAPPIPVSKPRAPASSNASESAPASNASESDASSGGPIQIARIPQVDDRIPQSDDAASDSEASLEPEAEASEPDPSEPAAEPAGEGGFMIQIAAFRTEPEAQQEYRRLRGKHSSLLESYGPAIQKADLGSRGIYYRLRVGPIASKEAASSLCSSLIEAGEKDCLVRSK